MYILTCLGIEHWRDDMNKFVCREEQNNLALNYTSCMIHHGIFLKVWVQRRKELLFLRTLTLWYFLRSLKIFRSTFLQSFFFHTYLNVFLISELHSIKKEFLLKIRCILSSHIHVLLWFFKEFACRSEIKVICTDEKITSNTTNWPYLWESAIIGRINLNYWSRIVRYLKDSKGKSQTHYPLTGVSRCLV